MTLQLIPMTENEWADYVEFLVRDYARENVEAGYWDEKDAIEKSRKQTMELLPQGVKTPNHHLFTVRDEDQKVGVVWMRSTLDSALKTGFIFDITIDEGQRGKGYGKKAMLLIEETAKEMGIQQMGLHVFAKNKVARGLYEKLGYETKSLNMTKLLS
jgi:ribosomal protein S18 acetylase RimI-like enzyme